MEEPGRRALLVEADDEDGTLVVEPEERVERHHEAPLGRVAAPRPGNLLELRAVVRVDLSGVQHPGREAGALQAMHRLAHLADRPSVEREARGVDHRLVAVIDRPKPE